MALYTETLYVPAQKSSLLARLQAIFAPRPLPDRDISLLTERELADVGVKRSREGLFVAEMRDIDRLGLGWTRYAPR